MPTVHAADIGWQSPLCVSLQFNDAACWNGGVVPEVGDAAVFNVASPGYTVTFPISPTNQAALVRNDTVTFDLSGASYNLTGTVLPARSLTVGQFLGDVGSLTLRNGTVTTVDLGLGIDSGSSGTLNISTGASLSNSGISYIGENGNGALTIENGGSLSNAAGHIGEQAGSVGSVTVDGAGSAWTNSIHLRIGYFGSGELTITNGATVSNIGTFDTAIGNSAGSTGHVTVDGPGSSLTDADDLYVGQSGTGTLFIRNGGNVSNNQGRIGNGSGSNGTVTVDGAGSNWANSGDLIVGLQGVGVLMVQNGGTVNSAGGIVGSNAGSNGSSVTVDGAGSQWISSSGIAVGTVESATLTIRNGGTVSATHLSLGHFNFSHGSATIAGAGSTLSLSGNLTIGNNFNFGRGTLNVNSGATVQVGNILSLEVGELNLNGGTIMTGSFVRDDMFIFNDGTLTIDGGSYNNGSVLNPITIDGTGAGANPTLRFVNGAVTLNGNLISEFLVGDSGTGTFDIESGSRVTSSRGRLGAANGASGTATVNGAGSQWAMLGELIVGDGGIGTLTIQNGGEVLPGQFNASIVGNMAGSSGTVTVDGAGSRWRSFSTLDVGGAGSGTLTIQNGGEVSNSGFSNIGASSGGSGIVTVDGVGSSWSHTGDSVGLNIGDRGTGALNIQNSAQVDVSSTIPNIANITLGAHSGADGTVIVNGPASTLTSSGSLAVGYDGTGMLMIQNGGSVSSLVSVIGQSSGSGDVIVDGPSSNWSSGQLTVNNGSVKIQNGGTLTVINGYNYENGTFDVGAGTTAIVSGVGFANHGLVKGAGTIDGNVTSDGTVSPGNSPGTLTITGDFAQSAGGIFDVEIGGLLAGTEYDVLNVSGTASLDGTLNVSLFDLGGGLFTPHLGDSFDILTADLLQGSFSSLFLATLDPGLKWEIGYLTDAIGTTDVVRLSVNAVPIPPSVWLFSSGLLGLIGIARRKAT